MSIGSAVLLILAFFLLYMIIVDVFTILFRLTGLSPEKAKFQVISLLTNSGYTTQESELITNDTLRRKFAQATMIFGYSFTAIIISLAINLLMALFNNNGSEVPVPFIVAIAVMICLNIIFRLKFVKRPIEKLIEAMANKLLYGKSSNMILVLDTYGDIVIAEIKLSEIPEFLNGFSLVQSGIKEDYDIMVLFKKHHAGEPEVAKPDMTFKKGDTMVVVGKYKNIAYAFQGKKK